jgi:outer membrane protein OmpA-like peptidoglycan-associated protein
MPKRVIVFAAIGLVVIGVAGYLAYAKVIELENQVAGLDRQLDDTEHRLAEADARAAASSQAANAAQSRANAAEERAIAARGEAEASAARTAEAEEVARMADTGREDAETRAVEAQRAQAFAEADSEAAQVQAQAAREAEAAARDEARAARDEADRIRLQREMELNRMQEAFDNIVETRRTAIGVVLNLGDRVEFEFDKSELRPQERELLARIAGVLIASVDQGYAIQVFGHTDDVGSDEYNDALSERRAQAVMDYLIDSGVDPDILTRQGMGKTMPLVTDTTDEARARNRRVEIAIVDTLIEFKPGRDQ